MAERYRFSYGPHTVYAHVVALIERHRQQAGTVVVDLGCGYGPAAEPLRDLGLTYIGADRASDGLADLAGRGFATIAVDLRDPAATVTAIRAELAGRRLAALSAMDVIEHTTNAEAILSALHELAVEAGNCPLVLSVPNVTHLDLAAKTLIGRWDVTPTGLLDETHVSLFSERRLTAVTRRGGWVEFAAHDFDLLRSDQHQPEQAAVLAEATPLHQLLAAVRTQAGGRPTPSNSSGPTPPPASPPTSPPTGRPRS